MLNQHFVKSDFTIHEHGKHGDVLHQILICELYSILTCCSNNLKYWVSWSGWQGGYFTFIIVLISKLVLKQMAIPKTIELLFGQIQVFGSPNWVFHLSLWEFWCISKTYLWPVNTMDILTPSLKTSLTDILRALHVSLLYLQIFKRGTFLSLTLILPEDKTAVQRSVLWFGVI